MIGCASTIRVSSLGKIDTKRKAGRGGIMFYLPKTIVSVTIPVKRIAEKKGEYSDFCQLFLGKAPDIKKDSLKISIDKPTYATSGKRDTGQVYYVEIPGGPFTANDLTLEMNAEGVLAKGASEQENKTAEFVVSTIETTGKIASTIMKGFSAQGDSASASFKRRAAVIDGCPPEVIELGLQIDAMTDPVEKDRKIAALEKTDHADHDAWLRWEAFEQKFQVMQSAAKEIETLRFARSQVLGQVGTAESKAAALKEIDDQLVEPEGLFAGTRSTISWPAKFELDPHDFTNLQDKPEDTFPLFTIIAEGPSAGVVEVNRGVTPPMPDKLRPAGIEGTRALVKVVLHGRQSVTEDTTALLETIDKSRSKSFRYRIPTETLAVLSVGGKPIGSEPDRLSIAQYGAIGYLPASTGSVKTKWDITLNAATGALEKVILNNKNFDPALIGRVGEAGNGFASALADRELAHTQREHDILKNKSEMEGYRKILNGEATTTP